MSTKMSIEEMEEEMASLEEKLGAEDSYASDGDDAEFEVTEDELPQLDASYDTVVVVIGIPVIPSSKVAKLNKLLLKIFSFHKRQSFQYYLEQEPLIVFFKSFHSITKCEIQTGRF